MIRTHPTIRPLPLKANKLSVSGSKSNTLHLRRSLALKGQFQKPKNASRCRLYIALEDDVQTTDSEQEETVAESDHDQDDVLSRKFQEALHASRIEKAREMLRHLHHPPVSVFNSLLRKCAETRRLNKCWECYQELLAREIAPDKATYSIMLSLCQSHNDKHNGLKLLAQLRGQKGLEMDDLLYHNMIEVYLMCDSLSQVQRTLHEMADKGLSPKFTTYGVIIEWLSITESAIDSMASFDMASNLFLKVKANNFKPNMRMYIAMVRLALASGQLKAASGYLEEVKAGSNKLTANVGIDFIMAFGTRNHSVHEEQKIKLCWSFQQYLVNHGISTNSKTLETLTKVFAMQRRWDLVFGTWTHFEQQAIFPSLETYRVILRELYAPRNDSTCALEMAKMVVKMMEKNVEVTPPIYALVVILMTRYRDINSALYYLEVMRQKRMKPNTYLYNECLALIISKKKRGLPAFEKNTCVMLYEKMKEDAVKPDDGTYNYMFIAIVRAADWILFESFLHRLQYENVEPTLKTYNVILNGCSKMKNIQKGMQMAWHYFGQILKSGQGINVATYTIMITVCIRAKDVEKGIMLFKQMIERGITPTIQTYTSLIKLVGDSGDLDMAFELFDEIKVNGLLPNSVTSSCLINVCARANKIDKAVEIFEHIQENGLTLEASDYGAIILAAGLCQRLDLVQQYFHEMKARDLYMTRSVYNTILKTLHELRDHDEAKSVLSELAHERVVVKDGSY